MGPPFKVGDLVKLIPLSKNHPKANLIPAGSIGVVLGVTDMALYGPEGGELYEPVFYLCNVKFFVLPEPVEVWATWLTKVEH